MKPRQSTDGYTIIEVMIFLTVSVALFGATVGALTAQNKRNQFTESVQTFNQRLQDALNDVSTGYFPSNSDFRCSLDGAGTPVISTGSSVEQGKNEDCVFAGKAFQFWPNEGSATLDPSKFNIYTLVGARIVKSTGAQVQGVEEANVIALGGSNPGIVDTGTFTADVQVSKVMSRPAGATTFSGNSGGFAILTGFARSAGSGTSGLKSGSLRTTLSMLSASTNQTSTVFLSSIESQLQSDGDDSITQAGGGMLLCIKEVGTTGNERVASITIGDNAGQGSTVVTIDSAPPECSS